MKTLKPGYYFLGNNHPTMELLYVVYPDGRIEVSDGEWERESEYSKNKSLSHKDLQRDSDGSLVYLGPL